MNALLAEIDLIEDHAWLGGGAFALLFGLTLLVAVADKGRRVNLSLLQLALAHAIFVPLVVWATAWCYRHPERLAATPTAWQYDLRIYWPFCAAFEAAVLFFLARIYFNPAARACRLMRRAHRLLAAGKVAEADAAYAEGRRLLDRA